MSVGMVWPTNLSWSSHISECVKAWGANCVYLYGDTTMICVAVTPQHLVPQEEKTLEQPCAFKSRKKDRRRKSVYPIRAPVRFKVATRPSRLKIKRAKFNHHQSRSKHQVQKRSWSRHHQR